MIRSLPGKLIIAFAAVAATASCSSGTVTQHATVLDTPRPLPDVALIDQHGAPFAIGDLNGRPTLVFFGFTNCPDVCPTTLAVIADAMRKLGERSEDLVPQVLFVSVDPVRDTPAQINHYLAGFDERFIGVTADEDTLAPLYSTLAVSVHTETRDGEIYRVTHNGTIYVLDRDSRWAALFSGSAQHGGMLTSDDLAGDFLAMRRSL